MKTLMFYNNVQPLNKELHKNLKVRQTDTPNLGFAKDTNGVVIALTALALCSKHYVTAFAATNEQADAYALMCVLGMRDNENLYLTEDNQWDANYIPAFVRRYPFVIAQNQDQYTVCIDDTFEQFNEEEGQPLFNEAGEPTELLQQNLNFLQSFQNDNQATQGFIDTLKELNLLEPGNPRMELNSGEKIQLNGLYVISETKLNALKPAQIKKLMEQGYLGLIYAHLLSLNNLNDLMNRMAKTIQAEKTTTANTTTDTQDEVA
ncbi:SapC family protein [Thiomicrospira microaerophila]|uniref:SapC family protein n=1 Tax=Thiomicrospira microaerophila TaxID=406020 RepID=UPI00069765E8|nr:SapC family protein [Thiomicrospira microaerophila]